MVMREYDKLTPAERKAQARKRWEELDALLLKRAELKAAHILTESSEGTAARAQANCGLPGDACQEPCVNVEEDSTNATPPRARARSSK